MNNLTKLNFFLLAVLVIIAAVTLAVALSNRNSGGSGATPTPVYVYVTEAPATTEEPAVNTSDVTFTAIPAATSTPSSGTAARLSDAELKALHVNEAGDIPIVMWHAFTDADSESYDRGTRQYTNSFDYLYELCGRLYDKGFRLISMTDYVNNNINVEAGKKPIVFTFDDGTPSQFSLVEEGGQLKLNPKCAVAVMQRFANEHPDFGFVATIYVPMGSGTGLFEGAGTVEQRIKYLLDLGWEVGNHTYGHQSLRNITADQIRSQLGRNQKAIEAVGGTFTTLALPYGEYDTSNTEAILSGTFEGTSYKNDVVLLVGAEPAHAVSSVNFKQFVPRIRSSGYLRENMDFEWWLANNPEGYWYVSDGKASEVTCPANWAKYVRSDLPGGQSLRTYEP